MSASGGDSKRVPQYSALGKLFSPVPHELPNGRSSTLFDEFMICMSSVPSRIREGMVLLSGDVLLLFNPLQIDYNNVGAALLGRTVIWRFLMCMEIPGLAATVCSLT